MYLLDANVLIDAKNRYYPFDVVPAFWDWLDQAHQDGTVGSIAKVYAELVTKEDELSDWAKARRAFFLDPDAETIKTMRITAAWAMDKKHHYTSAARMEFLAKADYYLVAQAAAVGATLVTNERSQPAAKAKIKIPDACLALGVPYATPFTMLRNEGVRFVSP